MKLDVPNMDAVDDAGGFMPSWVSYFTRITNWIVANSQAGTTAQRPTKGLSPGDKYFDSTLGLPVFVKSVNPVVWVQADGTVV